MIGVPCTIPLCEREKKEIWTSSYQRKLHSASLLISPFPSSLAPPFYLAIPFSLLNRPLMNPLPTDPPAATVSQRCLCPSPALLGRRFLLRPRGTRHILLQPAQEEEKRTVTRYEWNQICLTCLAAMTIFHAGRECQDWANGMQLLTVHLICMTISIWSRSDRVILFPRRSGDKISGRNTFHSKVFSIDHILVLHFFFFFFLRFAYFSLPIRPLLLYLHISRNVTAWVSWQSNRAASSGVFSIPSSYSECPISCQMCAIKK